MFLQLHDYDCVPTALVNAIMNSSWLGPTKCPYDLHKTMVSICYTNEDGTHDKDTDRVLKNLANFLRWSVKRKRKVRAEQLLDHLSDAGNFVLLNHIDNTGDWHTTYFFATMDNRVFGYNIFAGKGKTSITLPTFKKYCASSDGCWLVNDRRFGL